MISRCSTGKPFVSSPGTVGHPDATVILEGTVLPEVPRSVPAEVLVTGGGGWRGRKCQLDKVLVWV